MKYLWRTVRRADQEGLLLPPHLRELCDSFDKIGGYQLRAHVYIEGMLYPCPKAVATLALVFDENDEPIDETGILYLRESDIDLRGFYSALSGGSDLPPALLSWLIDSQSKAVRIGESPLHKVAVYGFTNGGEKQRSMEKHFRRNDDPVLRLEDIDCESRTLSGAHVLLEREETNIVLGAKKKEGGE